MPLRAVGCRPQLPPLWRRPLDSQCTREAQQAGGTAEAALQAAVPAPGFTRLCSGTRRRRHESQSGHPLAVGPRASYLSAPQLTQTIKRASDGPLPRVSCEHGGLVRQHRAHVSARGHQPLPCSMLLCPLSHLLGPLRPEPQAPRNGSRCRSPADHHGCHPRHPGQRLLVSRSLTPTRPWAGRNLTASFWAQPVRLRVQGGAESLQRIRRTGAETLLPRLPAPARCPALRAGRAVLEPGRRIWMPGRRRQPPLWPRGQPLPTNLLHLLGFHLFSLSPPQLASHPLWSQRSGPSRTPWRGRVSVLESSLPGVGGT